MELKAHLTQFFLFKFTEITQACDRGTRLGSVILGVGAPGDAGVYFSVLSLLSGAGISPSIWPHILVCPRLSPQISHFFLPLTPWVISFNSWLKMPVILYESKLLQPSAFLNSRLVDPAASSTHRRCLTYSSTTAVLFFSHIPLLRDPLTLSVNFTQNLAAP